MTTKKHENKYSVNNTISLALFHALFGPMVLFLTNVNGEATKDEHLSLKHVPSVARQR